MALHNQDHAGDGSPFRDDLFDRIQGVEQFGVGAIGASGFDNAHVAAGQALRK